MARMLSVAEAATAFGISGAQIRRLLVAGKLWGERYGNQWVVDERSIAAYMATERKTGPKGKRKQK